MKLVLPRTGVQSLELLRGEALYRASLAVSACPESDLVSVRDQVLHDQEIKVYESDTMGRWGAGFVRGRICAKQALASLIDDLDPRLINIDKGVFGQPVVRGAIPDNTQVNISHSGDWAAAVAFDEGHPMAIDVEIYSARKKDVILSKMTGAEVDAITSTSVPESMRLTVLWTIKESLSKVLRTGLMSPFEIYEIAEINQEIGIVVSTFEKFAQYKCLSFTLGEAGISIALPKRTEVNLDPVKFSAISL